MLPTCQDKFSCTLLKHETYILLPKTKVFICTKCVYLYLLQGTQKPFSILRQSSLWSRDNAPSHECVQKVDNYVFYICLIFGYFLNVDIETLLRNRVYFKTQLIFEEDLIPRRFVQCCGLLHHILQASASTRIDLKLTLLMLEITITIRIDQILLA